MTGPQPTEDKLIKDLILTNRRTDGKTITRKQYEKHGDYNPWQAVKPVPRQGYFGKKVVETKPVNAKYSKT